MIQPQVSGRQFGEKIEINKTCSLSYNPELLPPCWQWEGNFPAWKLETGNVGPGLTTSVLPRQRKKKKGTEVLVHTVAQLPQPLVKPKVYLMFNLLLLIISIWRTASGFWQSALPSVHTHSLNPSRIHKNAACLDTFLMETFLADSSISGLWSMVDRKSVV